MQRKFLLEDIESMQEENTELSVSTLLNQLIKSEWDSIDMYNTILATINSMEIIETEDIITTIKDITEEEYIHVGQLEKVLQTINQSAELILDGAEEAVEDTEVEAPLEVED